jgi:hypothetical protein
MKFKSDALPTQSLRKEAQGGRPELKLLPSANQGAAELTKQRSILVVRKLIETGQLS